MTEVWKDVPGYEGLYMVSNEGIIRSKSGITRRPYEHHKGYLCIRLSKNNVGKNHMIHRIVAEAFIPNPENKLQVNHINGIKDDNRLENLQWCTGSENVRHAYDTGLAKSATAGKIYTTLEKIERYQNRLKMLFKQLEDELPTSQTNL